MHLNPWHILVIAMAGWMNRQQSAVVEYLQEENRILKHKLKGKRPRRLFAGKAYDTIVHRLLLWTGTIELVIPKRGVEQGPATVLIITCVEFLANLK